MEFGANEGESPVVLRILAHGSPCALESRRLGNCESKVKST